MVASESRENVGRSSPARTPENGRRDYGGNWQTANVNAAPLRFAHRPPEEMDPRGVWLPHHHLGCRPSGLEAARAERSDRAHSQGNEGRFDCPFSRYSSADDRSDAGDVRSADEERIQVGDRHRIACHGDADPAETDTLP